jgi:hypothetical protein
MRVAAITALWAGGQVPHVAGVLAARVGAVVTAPGRPERGTVGAAREGGRVVVFAAAVDRPATAARAGAEQGALRHVGAADRDAFAECLGTAQRNPDGVQVEVVGRVRGQQEHELVGGREPVAHRLGHRVAFGPHHRVAQHPPIGLQRQRHAPRHAHEILARHRCPAVDSGRADLLAQYRRRTSTAEGAVAHRVGAAARGLGTIGVAEVEPHRARRFQHAPQLREQRAQGVDVVLRRGFEPVLLVDSDRAAAAAVVWVVVPVRRGGRIAHDGTACGGRDAGSPPHRMLASLVAADPAAGAVVPQPPIGRRGHHTVHRVSGQRGEGVAGVAGVEGNSVGGIGQDR